MRIFKRFLSEADSISQKSYYKSFNALYSITDRRYNEVEEWNSLIYDGKSIDKELKKYDEIANTLASIIDKAGTDEKLIIDVKGSKKLLSNYERLKNGYIKYQKPFVTIFSTVKVGMDMKKAIPLLSRLTKELMYFNLEANKVTTTFFDHYTESEIKDEIEKFDGSLKLRGAMDLYVKFINGKVAEITF